MSDAKPTWTRAYDIEHDQMIYWHSLRPLYPLLNLCLLADNDIPAEVRSFCEEHGVDVCAFDYKSCHFYDKQGL